MSRIAWHRPARLSPPRLPDEQLVIPMPPQVQNQAGGAGWMMIAMPLLSSASIAAYLFVSHNTTLIFVALGVITASITITVAYRLQMRRASQGAREGRRERYLAHLAGVKEASRELAGAQRAAAAWLSPSPRRLWAIAVERRRVWERRPDDPDFLVLRAGVGTGPLASPLEPPRAGDPTLEYDDELFDAADRLTGSFGTVGGQAATVDVGRAGVVSIMGEPAQARAVARALITQLAVLHAPDDVALAVSAGKHADEWLWAAWLPHAREQTPPAGGAIPEPLVAADLADLSDIVERELTRAQEAVAALRAGPFAGRADASTRHFVLVIDGFHAGSEWARDPRARRLVELAGPEARLTVISLVTSQADEPSRVDARLRVGPDGKLALEARRDGLVSEVSDATADLPPVELCEATARALAPLTLTDERPRGAARAVPLTELLGTADIERFDPRTRWLGPADDRVLSSGIGLADDGSPVILDLKEAARGGMGPHGLVVGATGSGKSELLRTLLTGLAARHSPDLLSLVLVDFKGGATFAPMAGLPHVAGLITNLADDLALVDRVRDALIGEQQRRQSLLRDAGNVDSIREYQIRQAAGELDVNGRPLEPLPYLLVVVDEFGELLASRQDFITLFVQIGRVGRSLGIHLLLASQRLEEGRLRGLESHLSYRIGLRTFSPMESRIVLGTPDAYHLPNLPGAAYLKVGESVYQRFRAAYVSGAYVADAVSDIDTEEKAEIKPLTLREAPAQGQPTLDRPQREAVAQVTRLTQMQVLVERLSQFGQPVHQVWLPPLPATISLDQMLSPLEAEADGGLQAADWPLLGTLRFPVGLVDLPLSQEQQPLILDLAQAHPHIVLVGAPQTGKSTFLRTALLSAMLTHTPQELRFACLDYGGGALHAFTGAPHVSAVALRGEDALTRRILAETVRLIGAREAAFRRRGISSAAEFRRLRDEGELAEGDDTADVCLVIDNWAGLRGDVPDVDAAALEIAARGPGVGVHLLLTAGRWGDIRANLRDAISARLELRLNEPAESEVSRQAARLVPAGVPGRGLAAPGNLFQVLLPRADGDERTTGLDHAQQELLDEIRRSWRGPVAPPVRLLPETIHVDELDLAGQTGRGALIAVDERDLAPVWVDLTDADQHCLVIGDGSAGKTSFLRTLMRGLAAQQPPEAIRFLVVDYRRGLGDTVPGPYIGASAGDARTAGAYATQLAETLAQRLPPPGISGRELRDRAWWTGPELYLVVDDYDLLEGPSSPLRPLFEYLPSAREIGFHVVVARRSGGIARSIAADAVVSRLRDLGAVTLVLSADPREGVIVGDVRGADRPPGRGVLARRRAANEIVQVLLSDPANALE
jgi:S-DNA-T family DNA segregation ATPase FtsK/SpoIIIE